MTLAPRAILAVILCTNLALPPTVHAQPVPAGRPEVAAAEEALKRGELRSAALLYQQAFGRTGNWKYAWNAARVLAADGDLAGARIRYGEAAAAAGDGADRGKIAEALADLEARMLGAGFGRLTVAPLPTDATVLVEGERLDPVMGRRAAVLEPGAYRLKVAHVDYEDIDMPVLVSAGQDLRLAPVLHRSQAGTQQVAPVSVTAPAPATGTAGVRRRSVGLALGAAGGLAMLLGGWWLVDGEVDRLGIRDRPVHSLTDADAAFADLRAAEARVTRGFFVGGAGLVAMGAAAWLFLGGSGPSTASGAATWSVTASADQHGGSVLATTQF